MSWSRILAMNPRELSKSLKAKENQGEQSPFHTYEVNHNETQK